MPWEQRSAMSQRTRFVAALLEGDREMAELCREFGISRKTGYKWWTRFDAEGGTGLEDRSRAPKHRPHAVAEEVVQAVLQLRGERPTWGPKKLVAYLERQRPDVRWPAISTVAALLKQHGLAAHRRQRSVSPPWTQPFVAVKEPNSAWSADFKGQFRLGNGRLCYPLTLTDNHSRYLLRCQALERPTLQAIWPTFVHAFREYGLPGAVRTDNGTPFASTSGTGLSRLSVRLLKLGVIPERIRRGHPEENGRHERMHRTLKAEACAPAAKTFAGQQRVFEAFRNDFNHTRPHEALGFDTPGEHYETSSRVMPDRLSDPEYGPPHLVRKVDPVGVLYLHRHQIQVGRPLAGERVGVREVDDGLWIVRFAFMDLGLVDLRRGDRYLAIQPLTSSSSDLVDSS